MNRYVACLVVFGLFVGLLVLGGCAASRPSVDEEYVVEEEQTGQEDDYAEIEKLLGISREEASQQEAAETSQEGEDDLMKLLQADEAGGTIDEGTAAEPEMPRRDPRLEQLQRQVENLNQQVLEQKRIIADLKAQLMMKEEELRKFTSGEKGFSGSSRRFAASGSFGGVAEGDYEAEYARGLELFQNRQYRQAIQVFESLLAQDTRQPLSDNAQYWIGECYFALGDYRAAIVAFEKVFTFKQSNKNDYAQYKLGLCYFQLGDKKRARVEFQHLIDNYPDSPLVEKARQYLMKL